MTADFSIETTFAIRNGNGFLKCYKKKLLTVEFYLVKIFFQTEGKRKVFSLRHGEFGGTDFTVGNAKGISLS